MSAAAAMPAPPKKNVRCGCHARTAQEKRKGQCDPRVELTALFAARHRDTNIFLNE
jgi:hypothetical protein